MTRVKPRNLRFRQRAGWLVHHQDSTLDAQRFRDFDQLLIANSHAPSKLVCFDIAIELSEQFRSFFAHGCVVSKPPSGPFLTTEKDIGSHRKLLDQVQFLVDD